MGLVKYSYEEMILLDLHGLSTLMPHYWSQLILLAEQLLSPEERMELNEMIFNVEKMVLETEIIPERDEDGNLVWVERIRGEMSLYDIEMAFESNQDYYAYFQKDDGTIVTKFDVERKLDKIRKHIYEKVRIKSTSRRFNRMR
jgi:hypothetical protein